MKASAAQRRLVRGVTAAHLHGHLNRQQATRLTMALLRDNSELVARALVTLASVQWGCAACDPDLTAVLLALAPAHTRDKWAGLRRHAADLADARQQVGALEDDPDAIDAYIDGPIVDRDGYRAEILATLRSDVEHLPAEMLVEARWLAGLSNLGTPAAAGTLAVAP